LAYLKSAKQQTVSVDFDEQVLALNFYPLPDLEFQSVFCHSLSPFLCLLEFAEGSSILSFVEL
jgi:hypothetical protein